METTLKTLRRTLKVRTRTTAGLALAFTSAATLFLVSCASAGPEAIATPVPAAQTNEVKKPVATPVRTPVVVSRVKTVTVAYPDGMISGVTANAYDTEGRITREDQKNGDNVIVSSRLFTYKTNNSVEISTLDATGETKGKTIQELNLGRVVKEKILNPRGELQSTSEYQYDKDGNKIAWLAQGVTTGQTITEYTWEKGLNIRIAVKDASGAIIKRYERVFDADGHLTNESEFDTKGVQLSKGVYSWKSGFLVSEETFDPKNILLRAIRYTPDNQGRIAKIEYLNRSGQVLEVKTNDWITLKIPALDK